MLLDQYTNDFDPIFKDIFIKEKMQVSKIHSIKMRSQDEIVFFFGKKQEEFSTFDEEIQFKLTHDPVRRIILI